MEPLSSLANLKAKNYVDSGKLCYKWGDKSKYYMLLFSFCGCEHFAALEISKFNLIYGHTLKKCGFSLPNLKFLFKIHPGCILIEIESFSDAECVTLFSRSILSAHLLLFYQQSSSSNISNLADFGHSLDYSQFFISQADSKKANQEIPWRVEAIRYDKNLPFNKLKLGREIGHCVWRQGFKNVDLINPKIIFGTQISKPNEKVSKWDFTISLNLSGNSLKYRTPRPGKHNSPMPPALAFILLIANKEFRSVLFKSHRVLKKVFSFDSLNSTQKQSLLESKGKNICLLDIFCGSGSICIEAVNTILGIPACAYRTDYLFHRLPFFNDSKMKIIANMYKNNIRAHSKTMKNIFELKLFKKSKDALKFDPSFDIPIFNIALFSLDSEEFHFCFVQNDKFKIHLNHSQINAQHLNLNHLFSYSFSDATEILDIYKSIRPYFGKILSISNPPYGFRVKTKGLGTEEIYRKTIETLFTIFEETIEFTWITPKLDDFVSVFKKLSKNGLILHQLVSYFDLDCFLIQAEFSKQRVLHSFSKLISPKSIVSDLFDC